MLPLTFASSASAITDQYANFSHLKAHEIEGVDYRISSLDTCSDVSIIAIHGGSIEKGTTELAQGLATKGYYDYYSFQGIKKSNNLSLHITSTNYDEPIALNLVGKSSKTISIHGCVGESKETYIGGLDTELAQKIKENLQAAGFIVTNPPASLGGIEESNIANRNLNGRGLQVEVSKVLRESFFNSTGTTTDVFDNYVSALDKALHS